MTRAHNDNMMTKSNKQWWQALTRWLWEDRAWHPPLFTLIQHFQFIFFVISIWGKRRLWAFAYAYTIYIAYQRVAIKHFQSIEMRYSPKTPEEDSVQQHLKPNSLGQASCIIVHVIFRANGAQVRYYLSGWRDQCTSFFDTLFVLRKTISEQHLQAIFCLDYLQVCWSPY